MGQSADRPAAMLRLHYATPTCSLASMVARELAGADYETVRHDMFVGREALRAINPLGKIPVLETDDRVITDTVAIIYWIARTHHQSCLLPSDAEVITLALSRMCWLGSYAHIVRRRHSMPTLFANSETAADEVRTLEQPVYRAMLEQIAAWATADALSGPGAEAYALLFYHWGAVDGFPVDRLPAFSGLGARLMEHDGVRCALDCHASPLLALVT